VRRSSADRERWLLATLIAATLVSAVLMFAFPAVVSAAILMVPLVVGSLLLPPRLIPGFVGFVFLVLMVETVIEFGTEGIPARRWVNIVVVSGMSAVVVWLARRRTALGITGIRGDTILLDLRERIGRQGVMPPLPRDWYADAATRPAGGTTPFAGDFTVAHLSGDQRWLSVAVVDVSGKGVDAGPRSLLLSGALGALVGSVPPDKFLLAANDFLVRQEWHEGFATAVHVCLDLTSGSYEIRSAGHPPAVQFRAGSGQWQVHDEIESPALGLVSDPFYPAMTGRLDRGDVLLLYTDGMVERRRRDISLGIDRLVGEAERLVSGGFAGSAHRLVYVIGDTDDDCAVVVLKHG
jgi:hypothetical protein